MSSRNHRDRQRRPEAEAGWFVNLGLISRFTNRWGRSVQPKASGHLASSADFESGEADRVGSSLIRRSVASAVVRSGLNKSSVAAGRVSSSFIRRSVTAGTLSSGANTGSATAGRCSNGLEKSVPTAINQRGGLVQVRERAASANGAWGAMAAGGYAARGHGAHAQCVELNRLRGGGESPPFPRLRCRGAFPRGVTRQARGAGGHRPSWPAATKALGVSRTWVDRPRAAVRRPFEGFSPGDHHGTISTA